MGSTRKGENRNVQRNLSEVIPTFTEYREATVTPPQTNTGAARLQSRKTPSTDEKEELE